ncbi:hypothetical protein EPO05_00790 [Patescibacteria group bacterium]|nr:MAG: hypothetical protein EPO05_00790 [Patescibacteria group bacterium]
MSAYLVSLYSWEKPRCYTSDSDFALEDRVVVEGEFGVNVGTVLEIVNEAGTENAERIIRRATERDIDAFEKNEHSRPSIMQAAKDEVKRLGLEMKLIDANVSIDGSSVVIIFTAEGRVDFRELVKSLSRIIHRSVKMHQIGSREEARKLGGCGVCGRSMCCVLFPGSLPSISTEMARVQQVAHRGSERISGQCGRLMCCLSYEAPQYRQMLEGMPEIGSSVKTSKGRGTVIELNVMKQEVKIRLEDGSYTSVAKQDIK